MINLIANHQYLVGENSCGCSSRKMGYLGAFLEVILIVGAILALAKVGGWGTLTEADRLSMVVCAAIVVLVDIIRTVVNRCNIAEANAPIEARKTKLAVAGVKIEQTSSGYVINIKALYPTSQRSHIYPVYTDAQASVSMQSMKAGEFFFHFRPGSSTALSDVLFTGKSYQPLATPTTADCFDNTHPLHGFIESGRFRPYGRDDKLKEFIDLDTRKQMYFKNGTGQAFTVKDQATASASQNTLQPNECILFWEFPDDQSLSTISCMTKDGIFPEWCDDLALREKIKSGAIIVK